VNRRREVILVGQATEWHTDLAILLGQQGYAIGRAARLDEVVRRLDASLVHALFIAAGPFAASDFLLVRQIREISPATAVVMVTKNPTDPDVKRAFEIGATAFLSWPASPEALQCAIERGSVASPAGTRP
jgi:DNA-binding response OmpR family regulator